MELARATGVTPVIGQSFSKFLDYNSTVMFEVKRAYPGSYKELGDPNEILAVKVYKSTCKC